MVRQERDQVLAFLRRLAATKLGEEAILAGSSGVYGVSGTVPALTEDLDVAVDAEWLAANEAAVLADLAALGLAHEPGTPTFVGADGLSLDLIGYSRRDRADWIGGGEVVPVMVFADLSTILAVEGAAIALPAGGGRALCAAALAAAKLLTVRLEKGSKDKIQALLLIDERAGEGAFEAELRGLLARFPPDRLEDATADAQAAFLALSGDAARAARADPQSAGYAGFVAALERGLGHLVRIARLGGGGGGTGGSGAP